MFKEVTFSYNILSDPDKRLQYDTAGFEVRYAFMQLYTEAVKKSVVPCFRLLTASCTIKCDFIDESWSFVNHDVLSFRQAVEAENQELELDLSSLGAVNTMFAALFSKLGVPIKTTVSATVLEEALNGVVTIQTLLLGQPVSRKVEKQCAHFYSVEITEEEARDGFVCRVQSSDKSKFKVDIQ
ncbi:hypothetical protein Goari_024313 [Gossypium aridum]|uniref:Uncharacterized protein n=1 Tax=Gossypium aridum TaxID=34290 RepID=A0A7J8X5X8_GOSAI|nr:hypothetical protein [Gossypium aridum]